MRKTDGPFIIPAQELNAVLKTSSRIYLSGDLKNPQTGLRPLTSTAVEMGVSQYDAFSSDTPHMHLSNIELNYVVEGETHLFDIERNTVWELPAGSVFILEPNTPYATKHKGGTKVVFFKSPGGNDKMPVEVTSEVQQWLNQTI